MRMHQNFTEDNQSESTTKKPPKRAAKASRNHKKIVHFPMPLIRVSQRKAQIRNRTHSSGSGELLPFVKCCAPGQCADRELETRVASERRWSVCPRCRSPWSESHRRRVGYPHGRCALVQQVKISDHRRHFFNRKPSEITNSVQFRPQKWAQFMHETCCWLAGARRV